MPPQKTSLVALFFLLTAALMGCSDAPVKRNSSRTPDAGVLDADTPPSDATPAKGDAEGDADGVGDTCVSDDDCEAGENQRAVCDPDEGQCLTSCDEGFADCDGDPANGCEVDLSSDIAHCGACDNMCPTLDNFLPVCSPGDDARPTCSIDATRCAEDFVDLNGNPDDGCECEITDPDDPIDEEGSDANCDGVPGVLADSVFVSPDGDDAGNDGLTPETPLRSINSALQAAADQGRHHVLVAGGTYQGTINLRDGISIYGGFVADDFSRDLEEETTIIVAADRDFDADTTNYVTIYADALEQTTTLDNLSIQGFDASNDGASTVALFARNSPGLSLQSSTIVGGSAARGGTAPAGETLECSPALEGGNPGEASGAEPCNSTPTNGTPAPAGNNGDGFDITEGTGLGGGGGEHNCNGSAGEGKNGTEGTPGRPGTAGQPPAEDAIGSFDAEGIWTPASSHPPTDGTRGGGGGGGGAGGNHEKYAFGSPVFGSLKIGGKGGKGGDGGCEGGAGTSGAPGGTSFGVVVIGAAITMTDITVTLGSGGPGGDGSRGGPGADGSAPEPGTPVSGSAGDGGRGGDGGFGGPGGNGAGGRGGNAIGVATYDAAVDSAAITFDDDNAAAGDGGAGASPAGTTAAPDGQSGVIEELRNFGSSS